jgi:hypothetical protein
VGSVYEDTIFATGIDPEKGFQWHPADFHELTRKQRMSARRTTDLVSKTIDEVLERTRDYDWSRGAPPEYRGNHS